MKPEETKMIPNETKRNRNEPKWNHTKQKRKRFIFIYLVSVWHELTF
jgi:hypothetical protein